MPSVKIKPKFYSTTGSSGLGYTADYYLKDPNILQTEYPSAEAAEAAWDANYKGDDPWNTGFRFGAIEVSSP